MNFDTWFDDCVSDLIVQNRRAHCRLKPRNNKHGVSVIHGEEAQMVNEYKYLRIMFDDKLRFNVNGKAFVKTGQ